MHGPVGNSALPGQNRTVRHESDQTESGETVPDKLLILAQKDRLLHLRCGKRTVKEGGGDALRKIVEEDLPELAGQHRTPCSGEAHFKTDDQIGGGEFTGCANQNLLPRTTHPDETALSGTAGLKGEASRCPAEATQDMIRQRRALICLRFAA